MGKRREGRTTVYNDITSEEKLAHVNKDNLELENDFLNYLTSVNRSNGTIKQYKANLHVFWCWNLEFNKNKPYVSESRSIGKRDIVRFQHHAISEWGWSPKRLRTVKATLSSLSNFIENILDDEYPEYKSPVNKVESPPDVAVREKTVFKEKQLQKLLDMLVENGEYMKACVLSFAMNSGRRKAEIPRMKVSYFTESNLICEGALYKTPEKVVTKGKGVDGKLLDIYVLAKPFQPYLDLWMAQRKELGIKSEWLFVNFENGKWTREPLRKTTLEYWALAFSRYLSKPFYWHSMRHYLTTKLSESNLPDGIIQDMIGWESADMVRTYVDTEKDKQFEKYFGAEGIRKTHKMSLEEL